MTLLPKCNVRIWAVGIGFLVMISPFVKQLFMDANTIRVLVVPTESDTGIYPGSNIEDVLACPETSIYSLEDYFQAQNDDELGMHWSFVYWTEKKPELATKKFGKKADSVKDTEKIKALKKKVRRLQKAYQILMGYFDSLPDEDKHEVDKKLAKLDL